MSKDSILSLRSIARTWTLAGLSLLLLFISFFAFTPGKASPGVPPPSAAATIINTVESSDKTGYHSSMVLNNNGFPVISYFKRQSDIIKLAICSDEACTTSTVGTISNTDEVGFSNSIALNSSGIPVMGYGVKIDSSFHQRLAFCNNLTCSNPSFTTIETQGAGPMLLNSQDFPIFIYSFSNTLYLITCKDKTCTQYTKIPVDNSGLMYAGSLALNSSGNPVIAYMDDDKLNVAACSNDICTIKSIFTIDDRPGIGSISLKLNSQDLPVISFAIHESGIRTIYLATCKDIACGDSVVKTVDSNGDVGIYSKLQLTQDDVPVVSYMDWKNGDLKTAVCDDQACGNPSLVTVDRTGSVGVLPSLVLNDRGIPIISYLQTSPGFQFKVAVCNICIKPILTTIDAPDSVGTHTSLALNQDNNPVISYSDPTKAALNLAVCKDAACKEKSITQVDNPGRVEHTSLALKGNGAPVTSYYDDQDDDLELAICNDAACSNPTKRTVDEDGLVGKFSSIALNSSGLPVISYYDESKLDLKLAVCNDTQCSNPAINTVDGATSITGLYTSIALTSSGSPVISYQTVGPEALMLAVCVDPLCSTPITPQPIDTGNKLGWFTSIALNSLGFPVISYYDADNDILKVAVCNNLNCTSPTIKTVDDL